MSKVKFVDKSGRQTPNEHKHRDHSLDLWDPVTITGSSIKDEAERLANLPAPNNGIRRSFISHPRADDKSLGLAPGTDVSLHVLLPGEKTKPMRHNSSAIHFCIDGAGSLTVDNQRFDYEQYDVITIPAMAIYHFENTSNDRTVALRYSNGALLERMNIHWVDEDPPSVEEAREKQEEKPDDPTSESPYGTFQLTDDGGWLMPYEKLINPAAAEINPHHWPWQKVKAELDKLAALGKSYRGRRLYLLYDPVTGRANGTTPNFFATFTIRPPGISDRPHRHASSAINYYFAGSGHSIVEGKKYPWDAGDLMLSAPGWARHNHASHEEAVYELTVQDMPLLINMNGLLWQEDLRGPISLLGSQPGFATNRENVG